VTLWEAACVLPAKRAPAKVAATRRYRSRSIAPG
jgi:hypothetical protein